MQQYLGAPDLNFYIQGKQELYLAPNQTDPFAFQPAPAPPQHFQQTYLIPQQPLQPAAQYLQPVPQSPRQQDINQMQLNGRIIYIQQDQVFPEQAPIPLTYPNPQPSSTPKTNNKSCFRYCFQIFFYILLSFSRIGLIFTVGVLPAGILWIIADLLFITSTCFICCTELLTRYRIYLKIFIACLVIDLAGLIYSCIYIGINTSTDTTQQDCYWTTTTASSDQTTTTSGYYYGLDYITKLSESVELCENKTTTSKNQTAWLIVLPILSVIMYSLYLCLFCCTKGFWIAPQSIIPQKGDQNQEASHVVRPGDLTMSVIQTEPGILINHPN